MTNACLLVTFPLAKHPAPILWSHSRVADNIFPVPRTGLQSPLHSPGGLFGLQRCLRKLREVCFSRSDTYLRTYYLDTHFMADLFKIESLGSKCHHVSRVKISLKASDDMRGISF
jgi:hypothetical protein